MIRPGFKLWVDAEDGLAMGINLGVLAGTASTGRSQASALGSKVFTLADSREILIDSRRYGVI
jgi:hypothetical protein